MINFQVGMIVKVLDFTGVVTAIEPDGESLYITVDSPKRICLHQPNPDRLDYNALPSVWQLATPQDLLQEFAEWVEILDLRR